MLSQNHHRSRLCVVAAVVAAALVAAACGSDDTTTVPEPAAATTTAATTQPAAPETTASVQEPAVDVGTGTTVETDELPSTTTVSVVVSSEAAADEEDPADAAQDVPDQEPCPEGEHGHDDECHDDDPAPEPETITAAAPTTTAPTAAVTTTTTAAPAAVTTTTTAATAAVTTTTTAATAAVTTTTTAAPAAVTTTTTAATAAVTTTTTAAPEPVVATTTTVPEVFCAEGLMPMPEHATDTDDGCRYEACDNGRTSDGWCRGPDYVEVENPDDDPGEPVEPSTDPNDHPCQRQDDSADGLLGICTYREVRYCFDHEWLVCPGGGEPCPSVSGPLAFSGRGGLNTVRNPVLITTGRWRADICLWDSPYGASGFSVGLWDAERWFVAQVDSEWSNILEVRGPESGELGVAEGRWTVEFDAPFASVQYQPISVFVSAAAGGEWTVVFTRLEDDSDTG